MIWEDAIHNKEEFKLVFYNAYFCIKSIYMTNLVSTWKRLSNKDTQKNLLKSSPCPNVVNWSPDLSTSSQAYAQGQEAARVILLKSVTFQKYWITVQRGKKGILQLAEIGESTGHPMKGRLFLFSPLGMCISAFTLQLILYGQQATCSPSSYKSQVPSR